MIDRYITDHVFESKECDMFSEVWNQAAIALNNISKAPALLNKISKASKLTAVFNTQHSLFIIMDGLKTKFMFKVAEQLCRKVIEFEVLVMSLQYIICQLILVYQPPRDPYDVAYEEVKGYLQDLENLVLDGRTRCVKVGNNPDTSRKGKKTSSSSSSRVQYNTHNTPGDQGVMSYNHTGPKSGASRSDQYNLSLNSGLDPGVRDIGMNLDLPGTRRDITDDIRAQHMLVNEAGQLVARTLDGDQTVRENMDGTIRGINARSFESIEREYVPLESIMNNYNTNVAPAETQETVSADSHARLRGFLTHELNKAGRSGNVQQGGSPPRGKHNPNDPIDLIDMYLEFMHGVMRTPVLRKSSSLSPTELQSFYKEQHRGSYVRGITDDINGDRTTIVNPDMLIVWLWRLFFVDVSSVGYYGLKKHEHGFDTSTALEFADVVKQQTKATNQYMFIDRFLAFVENCRDDPSTPLHVRSMLYAFMEASIGHMTVFSKLSDMLNVRDTFRTDDKPNITISKDLDVIIMKKTSELMITYVKVRSGKGKEYNQRFGVFVDEADSDNKHHRIVVKYNDDNVKYYQSDLDENGSPIPIQNLEFLANGKGVINANKLTIQSYDHAYLFGPFNQVFPPSMSNSQVANDMVDVKKQLMDGKNVLVIGYGASGAGKTSTLVYFAKGREDGVLLEMCKSLMGELNCSTLSVHAYEAMARPSNGKLGRPVVHDRHMPDNEKAWLTFENQSGRIVLKTKYDHTNLHTERIAHQPSSEYIKQQNGATAATMIAGCPLGVAMTYMIDTDRYVKATTNNPNSSRSHVLVFVRFDVPGRDKKSPILIIGDFAGVENRFECDNADVLDAFATIPEDVPGGKAFYSVYPSVPEGLMQQGGQLPCENDGNPTYGTREGSIFNSPRFKLPVEKGRLRGDVQKYAETVRDTLQIRDMEAFHVALADCDATLIGSLLSTLRDLTTNKKYVPTQADILQYIIEPFVKYEEYSPNLAVNPKDGVWGLQRALRFITSINPMLSKKRELMKILNDETTSSITRLHTIGVIWPENQYPTTAANVVDSVKNHLNSNYNVDPVTDIHTSDVFRGLDQTDKVRIISKHIKDGIDKGKLFDVGRTRAVTVKFAIDIVVRELQAVIKSSLLQFLIPDHINRLPNTLPGLIDLFKPADIKERAEAIASIIPKFRDLIAEGECRTSKIMKVCNTRAAEGVFINNALADVRDTIQKLLARKTKDWVNLSPAFIDSCVGQLCESNRCFSRPSSSSQAPYGDIYEAIVSVMPAPAIDDLTLCIMCVLNISPTANNPPAIPFIDVHNLRNAYQNNDTSGVLKHATAIIGRIGPPSSSDPFHNIHDKCINDLWVTEPVRWMTSVVATMDPNAFQSQSHRVKDFLETIDSWNASSAIGTMLFVDDMAKFGSTGNRLCDNKEPYVSTDVSKLVFGKMTNIANGSGLFGGGKVLKKRKNKSNRTH